MEFSVHCDTAQPHGTQQNIVTTWNLMEPKLYFDKLGPPGTQVPLGCCQCWYNPVPVVTQRSLMELSWGWFISHNHFGVSLFCVHNGHCLPSPSSENIAVGGGAAWDPVGAGGQRLLFLQVGVINSAAMQHSASDLRYCYPEVLAFCFFPLGFFFFSPLAL